MNKLTKWIALLLIMALMLPMIGCGKDKNGQDGHTEKNSATQPSVGEIPETETPSYIGTWQGNDHDAEKVVHYLICDEDGYWHVYMNHETLKRAIKQLPNQLVSFMVFCKLQNSDHTGCFYEYVECAGDEFSVDEDGTMMYTALDGIVFTKVSDETGEPNDNIVAQAKDLFDRAREEALIELEK